MSVTPIEYVYGYDFSKVDPGESTVTANASKCQYGFSGDRETFCCRFVFNPIPYSLLPISLFPTPYSLLPYRPLTNRWRTPGSPSAPRSALPPPVTRRVMVPR